MNLEGKKVLVVGTGISGIAATELLVGQKIDTVLFDGNKELDVEKLKKELGDVLWYIAEACEALDLKLDDVMQTNIDKLAKRFKNGFTKEESINRKD